MYASCQVIMPRHGGGIGRGQHCTLLFLALLTTCMPSPAVWTSYEGIREISGEELANMTTALRDTPIKQYRYLFDTAGGKRKRLGPLPHELAVPSALRVLQVSEMVAPPRAGQQQQSEGLNLNCLLDEMSVVDETVLFTHTVAATKVLSHSVQGLMSSADELWSQYQRTVSAIRDMARSNDTTTAGRIELFRTNVTARGLFMEAIPELLQARREAGEAKRSILQRRWEAKQRAVSERMESEIRSIEAALEGQRAALALEMDMERAALKADSSGAKEASLEILAAQRRVEEAKVRAEIERALETARVQIDAEAEINRITQELALQRLTVEAAEERRYARAVVGMVMESSMRGLVALTSDWRRAAGLVLVCLLFITAVLAAHDVVVMGKDALSRRFERPQLVRDRSRSRRGNAALGLDLSTKSRQASVFQRRGVVLSPLLEAQLEEIVAGVQRARTVGLPLRNVLIHGPPGTGKSMIVEALCETIGLEVCVIGGSDFGPLGEMGAAEVHRLFNWARRASKGLMMVIEEAESALGDRRKQKLGDWRRSLLNAILWYTGEQSWQYMLVVVTNRPSDLDSAVLDRMDVVMEVGLPDLPERLRLLHAFFRRYLAQVPLPAGDEPEPCSLLGPLAKQLEGFTCREIEKLVLAVQRPSLQGEPTASESQLSHLISLASKLAEDVKSNKVSGNKDYDQAPPHPRAAAADARVRPAGKTTARTLALPAAADTHT